MSILERKGEKELTRKVRAEKRDGEQVIASEGATLTTALLKPELLATRLRKQSLLILLTL